MTNDSTADLRAWLAATGEARPVYQLSDLFFVYHCFCLPFFSILYFVPSLLPKMLLHIPRICMRISSGVFLNVTHIVHISLVSLYRIFQK